MANLLEQYQNSTNPTFVDRVNMALLARCVAALQENPQVPVRVVMAKKILIKPEDYVQKACQLLASSGLSASSSDSDIHDAINALTDLFSVTFGA